MTDNEIVYILTNPAMPGLVKIGRTGDLDGEVRELSRSAVLPMPFEVYYACTVRDAEQAERRLHTAFEPSRVDPNKKFFKIDAVLPKGILKLDEIEEVFLSADPVDTSDTTPPDEPATPDKVPKSPRKSPFSFGEVDIPRGATLTFLHDEEITATVAGNRDINFRGKITSLSAAAAIVLFEKKSAGKWSQSPAVPGPTVWCYKGETLNARRERLGQTTEDDPSSD